MSRVRTWVLAALATILLPVAAQAAQKLSADDQALVDQATAYLQNLGEVKGRFTQIDARGHVTHGELYLKRPGKARFVYDPPYGLQMVSDGVTVSVFDPRLKSFNKYPLNQTPLSLFLAKQIRLDKGVVVTQVTRFSNGFGLTAKDGRHLGQGQITLTFASDPFRLSDWTMTDARGQTTRVTLSGLAATSDGDPTQFEIRDPRRLPAGNLASRPTD